jgi:mono/diheme cytochrome c family protein
MKAVVTTLAGILVVSGLAVSAAPMPAPEAPQAAKVEAGKKVYDAQKCSVCHIIAGKGGKMASALDGVGSKLSVDDLKKWIVTPAEMEAKLATKPKMKMKAYKLADADLDALVTYLASLKK